MNVNKLAENLAHSIRKHDPDSSSVAVLRYSLVAIINAILVIGPMLLIGLFTGNALATLAAALAFPVLRYFSGGMHLKSSTFCNILSIVIIAICVYTPLTYWYNGTILTAISVLLLLIFAPSGIKQSKMPRSQYPLLKVVAVLIVCSNFIFQSPVLSIAFFAQAITTIPVFEKWLDSLNW